MRMVESHDIVVVGAGQAGLSISHELTRAGREHVVLDAGRVGQSWRTRWDSFCLVLPNRTVRLAGRPYAGPDPDGFMPRDEFVDYMSGYAASFNAPVREQVRVTSLERDGGGGFLLRAAGAEVRAREVIVATGGFQIPLRPAAVASLEPHMPVSVAEEYRRPDLQPPGGVLVIGSGQTGCQIAEELVLAGREVVLACGRAPWQPRRLGGMDTFLWLVGTPFLNQTAGDLPSPMARFTPNPQCTGRDGGRDLNYRTVESAGVTLAGHLMGVEGDRALFASDLAESIAFGDARYADICQMVRGSATARGVPVPEMPSPPPFVGAEPESVPLATFGSAVVACGYRPGYTRWIQMPEAFDPLGLPIQEGGSSTVVPGLHFMGVPFQRRRISATLYGVGEDAEALAERLT